ncbi:MAG: response regulator, partial [Chitinophagia bacterium]|nr:response regulator [Chitinophagia bacterium]
MEVLTEAEKMTSVHADSNSARFIVIDDDPLNNTICRLTIKKALGEAEVKTFTDPVQGLEYIDQEYSTPEKKATYTVLFLDINMPIMDGFQFAEEFQKTCPKIYEKIRIVLSQEDYMPAVDKSLKQFSKQAVIPGFRKGMVPAGVVRKMYGQSIFSDEVLRVAGTKLEEHLIASKAEIFARPIPAESQAQLQFDIQNPGEYTFEFEIGTKPLFELHLLQGAETMPMYKVTITDEMV